MIRFPIFTSLALALALTTVPAGASDLAANPTLPNRETLTIKTRYGLQRFIVEVARSPEQQERGLMFRTKINPHTGMIFPMSPPHPVAFWMKNCPIPEDMIFIKADGHIESIAKMTTPYSLSPVASGGDVSAVLEIAGGQAAKLHIVPGNMVKY